MTHRRWPTSLVAEQDTDLAEAAVEIQSLMEELRLAEKEIDRLAGQITEAAALHQAGGLDDDTALATVAHPSSVLREWTIRLLGDRREVSAPLASALAQRAAKRLFGKYLHASVEEILMEESIEQQKLIGSKNQIEAVTSQMQKRKAEFIDP